MKLLQFLLNLKQVSSYIQKLEFYGVLDEAQ